MHCYLAGDEAPRPVAAEEGRFRQAHINAARAQTSRSEDDPLQACDGATGLAEEVDYLRRAYEEEALRANAAEASARASGAEARRPQEECAEQEARARTAQDGFAQLQEDVWEIQASFEEQKLKKRKPWVKPLKGQRTSAGRSNTWRWHVGRKRIAQLRNGGGGEHKGPE